MKKITAASVAVAVLLLACSEEEGTTPREPERLEPTTPVNVLKNVELSFNRRHVGLLKDMLAEDFVFYFDPRDVGGHPPGRKYPIPEDWYYDEFWTAADNMFILAHSISLAIPADGVGTPAENEATYKAENVPISLLVMIDSLNGYIAERGYCNYEFERYESASGKKFWRLTGWWDRTSVGYDEYPGVEPTSLGRVLSLFR